MPGQPARAARGLRTEKVGALLPHPRPRPPGGPGRCDLPAPAANRQVPPKSPSGGSPGAEGQDRATRAGTQKIGAPAGLAGGPRRSRDVNKPKVPAGSPAGLSKVAAAAQYPLTVGDDVQVTPRAGPGQGAASALPPGHPPAWPEPGRAAAAAGGRSDPPPSRRHHSATSPSSAAPAAVAAAAPPGEAGASPPTATPHKLSPGIRRAWGRGRAGGRHRRAAVPSRHPPSPPPAPRAPRARAPRPAGDAPIPGPAAAALAAAAQGRGWGGWGGARGGGQTPGGSGGGGGSGAILG